MTHLSTHITRLLASLLLMTVSVTALAAPQISLSVMVEKDVIEIDEKGQEVVRRVEAADTAPGDTLFYTIRYANSGTSAARSVEINNAIPDGTQYQASSAWGDNSTILFSIDSGKTYKRPSNLTYEVRGRDGSTESRQVAPEQYNAIRWVVDEIPAGKEGATGFSVVVQ
jgi:uncharacterized repeat protein (TIGR01451 family)